MRKVAFTLITLIVIINLPFFDFLTQENFKYQNVDASFICTEENGLGSSFIGCQRKYGVFLKEHPERDLGDNRLFRTFTLKPWRFWEWRQMIFHSERFLLPYKEPKNK